MKCSNNWSVYLLISGNRTYIGSTTDPARRLRQHNGEIRGGARATRGRKWTIACYVSGFPNRSSACRWERICKCRARGYASRYNALAGLLSNQCPIKGILPMYPVPDNLQWGDLDPYEVREGIRWPY